MNTIHLVFLAAATATGMTVGPNVRDAGTRLAVALATAVALLLLVAELLHEAI